MPILELISIPKPPKNPEIALSAFVTAVSYLLLGSGTKLLPLVMRVFMEAVQ